MTLTATFSFENTLAGAVVEFPHKARELKKHGLRPVKVVLSGTHKGEDPALVDQWISDMRIALNPAKGVIVDSRPGTQ